MVIDPVLGHLGGIDEVGIFVVPAVLAVLALRWTERRAQQREAEQREAEEREEVGAEESGAD